MKWIGKLTMANKDGLIQKVKRMLKCDTIRNIIHTNKTKLVVLSKKLRPRKANRDRQKMKINTAKTKDILFNNGIGRRRIRTSY